MPFRLVQTYIQQGMRQCQFIVMAHAMLRDAAIKVEAAQQMRRETRYGGDFDAAMSATEIADRELWFAAQALLSAIANVDKVLWDGQSYEAERQPVRDALGVTTRSGAWITAREIRNHFDHYDEKIRVWDLAGEGMRTRGIGPLITTGLTPTAEWEGYDAATDTLRFWHVSVGLGPIEAEARRLIPLAADQIGLCPTCVDEGLTHRIRLFRRPVFPE